MRNKYILIGLVGIVVGVLLASVVVVLAGNIDSPAGPTDPTAQMYTLEQIYDRLDSGAAATKMTTFTEPSSGPTVGTMHTLDEIMAKAPAADNTNGAVPGEVLTGKTYWGLRTDGTWGPRTGSAAAGSNVNGADGSKTFNIPDGFYSGKTATANDSDLVAGNIKCGVTIFGVTGTLLPECVAKTGQTTSYGTGDDGAYQKGCPPVVAPSSGYSFGGYNRTSFTCLAGFGDNGDGTVTDNLTGLIWLKNANCFGYRTWTQALSDANGLASGSCGLTDGSGAGDWRLPNINELRSLFDPGLSAPYLPAGHPFTGVQSSYYWASTTRADNTTLAWFVRLSSGFVGYVGKTFTYYVWPVRGGQ